MAEYLLRHQLGGPTSWRVGSAGLFADEGVPASQPATSVMRERGIDLTPHRSRRVTQELLDTATLVVVMTTAHAVEVGLRFPEARDRVYLLKSFGTRMPGEDIMDPIGQSVAGYRLTRDEIAAALPDLIAYLRHYERGTGS